MPLTFLLFSVFLLAVPVAEAQASATVDRRPFLMGTEARIVVEADDREAAVEASERALAVLEETAARLSTWTDESELQRLNRAPADVPVTLSDELSAELAAAVRCWTRTGGAFDPGLGRLVEVWGLRSGGRQASASEVAEASAGAGVRHLELDDGIAVRRHAGLRLEEGGFGKGAGLDRALAALRASGIRSAWLDLGGQIAVLGREIPVSVAHPRHRHRAVLELSVDAGSVATSGTSERGPHLLDPRTGRPAADFGSVTVWAPTALEADCLATGLYVLGPDAALAWAEAHDGFEVVVLEETSEGLRTRISSGLDARVVPVRSEPEPQPTMGE